VALCVSPSCRPSLLHFCAPHSPTAGGIARCMPAYHAAHALCPYGRACCYAHSLPWRGDAQLLRAQRSAMRLPFPPYALRGTCHAIRHRTAPARTALPSASRKGWAGQGSAHCCLATPTGTVPLLPSARSLRRLVAAPCFARRLNGRTVAPRCVTVRARSCRPGAALPRGISIFLLHGLACRGGIGLAGRKSGTAQRRHLSTVWFGFGFKRSRSFRQQRAAACCRAICRLLGALLPFWMRFGATRRRLERHGGIL